MIDREITYNRETKDFDCFVDGRYVGSRPNYRAGDELCDEIAYDLCEQGLVDELPESEHADFLLGELDKAYDALTGSETPLLADVARVLDMALGNAPVKNVIPELRRVRARLTQTT